MNRRLKKALAVMLSLIMVLGTMGVYAYGEPIDGAQCICDTKCTEDSINNDCPVCGEGDISLCLGKEEEKEAKCICETKCTEDSINNDCPVCGEGGISLCLGKEEAKCICDTKCTEGEVNNDCPVCGGENGDISLCLGKEEGKTEPQCICDTKCIEGEVNNDCPVCGGEKGDISACVGAATAVIATPMNARGITATKPTTGDGTEGNPYKIGTAAELYWFAGLVNGTLTDGNGTAIQADTDAWAVLTADITINDNVLDENGTLIDDGSGLETWTPIGSYGDRGDEAYTGTFNGKNHTISGLYFDNKADYVGLFGYVGTVGVIQNVGVVDSYISGDENVGGVCGYNYGTIKNCYNTGDVSGSNSVGGVCGYNYYGRIRNCYNTGEVSGSDYVGGVCGWNSYDTIENCWNIGSVSGDENVGGVCGRNDDIGTIENCYNTGNVSGNVSGNNNMGGVCGVNGGTIENCYNTGYVSGGTAGGVCGASYGGTIENCYNTGAVSGESNVGGVCGYNNGTITNCYNTGTVIGSGSNVGGVCGYNNDSTITNCYNTGTVIGSGSSNVGGVCGYNNDSGTITNCYYLKGTAASDGGGTMLTESAFGVQSNFNGWDFNSVWEMDIPLGRPVLKDNKEESETDCGDGSADTPYLISGVGQLAAFASVVNGGETDVHAKLMNDIVIQTDVLKNDGTLNGNGSNFMEWTPIGSFGTNGEMAYTGTFDGNGHTISGLYVNGGSYVGLFGYLGSGGKIQNVGVVDSYISGSSNVGGVCGYNNNSGTITNCYNTGTVSGSGTAGGVCGYNNNSGTITNCYNTGTVSGGYAGGVCGYNNGTITNCYNTGTVSGRDVGGVCGYNDNSGTITNCYNTGAVSGVTAGGVCGWNDNGKITNCYNTGTVSGGYAGGVCGYNGGTIENCYFLSGTATGGIGGSGGTATNVEGKTEEQFTSGEAAWLLNGASVGAWLQDMKNNMPVLIDNLPEGVNDYKKPVRITIKKSDKTEEYGYTIEGSILAAYPKGYVFFEDSYYNTSIDTSEKTYTADITIYAAKAVDSITFNKTELSLYVGGEETLTVTIKPDDAYKNFTWSSSDNTVATVENGNVKAVKAGTAIITATASDGSGVKAECIVTVIQLVTGISLNKTELSLYVGGEETLTATVSPDTASQNLTWSSSDNTVATVDSGGKVTAVKAGTAIITATAAGGSGVKAECTVTVRKKSSSSSAPTEYNLNFDTNGGEPMSTAVEQGNTSIDLDKYVPTREGYKFVGWYADEDLTKPIDEITLTQSTTIYAKWEKIEEEEQEETTEQEETAVSFTDVRESDWFYKAVSYAVENSLMSGMGDGTFSPNTPLQREMFATVLWNLEGNPAPKDVAPFLDVTSDKYYADAIAWASENGIVAGFGDTFGVGVPITREQFAVMLHNYAQYKGYDVSVGEDTNILSYADAFDISDYAYPAMQWACGAGIINGMGDGTLAPQGQATRAETAAMLMNFCENVVK